ncbi:3-oxoadipate enol-lactonase [Pseudomonas nitroreducens]|uniref:3-oxoadipate enol-lactonase n=1 Tax=Pseudomonas nitroreducens TaxID=46680 RepID=A0ABS0KKC1_PSENT|nr:3-oxoadipate enol-lactonase [Pseudomonas nitroreducens]MBG6288076.1 3-oxoadipate enol-lactonase [Pseudomonas nitroreducens]MDG9852774.1 3-oxoadipate enol-lactonase [Pseudomonas nitroreducens]WEW99718.1 3-oxoadipate enol-lactonase [Pseudomonas nitroreducens]
MSPLHYLTTRDNARIAYRLDGADGLPLLVLSNSIGTDLHMWDGQIAALSEHFRVLRYDARGHGASSVPPGPYSLARLGEDVIELLDALGVQRAHFLGLSLGGFVGQWLALNAPQRIERLVLANTSAWLGPRDQWDARIAEVLEANDMRGTAATFLGNWFPATWLAQERPEVEPFRATLLATNRHGLAGSFAAVQETDLRTALRDVRLPTLVIAGQFDTVTAASHSELIAEAIPGARLLRLPAVHLSNIEFPREFEGAVLDFLQAR